MKVTIVTTTGDDVTIDDMPDANVAELLEDWHSGTPTLTIVLDAHDDRTRAVTHINTAHIVRIDVE